LHAPTSGTIAAIGDHPIAHPSGLKAPCLILEPDGQEQAVEPLSPLADYRAADPGLIRRRVREAGVVGLGGAAFPTAVKLNPGPSQKVGLLVLNGAECEPYITCDDLLMRERAREIVGGLLIMIHALQVREAIIGVEDNKPEARQALAEALEGIRAEGVRLQTVPTIYPAGGEKQLIKVLTGREIPAHGIPAEIGIVCQNVGTAAAVYRAVLEGQPLISRYLTVTGQGVSHPGVLEVPIGTPVAHLVEQCGGYTDKAVRLVMGGPMMGFALGNDQVPVVKGSNCIWVAAREELAPNVPSLPCIRCGACVEACPASLLPQQLYWYAKAKDFDKTQDYNLFDCIECGCCSAVCPSHLPLVQYYRFAKTEIWAQERDRRKADLARQRFEARQERLEREKAEKAEKLAKKKAAVKKDQAGDGQDPKKAAIEAALARAKARKAEAQAVEKAGEPGQPEEAMAGPPRPAEPVVLPEQQRLLEAAQGKRPEQQKIPAAKANHRTEAAATQGDAAASTGDKGED
ncbi:MAG: electron transport complex subunit RsxC, partial [Candidatus Competibacteraceae bacterium]|nr:electron transport complex subunit RsxC [Candidatus Competibacteraceae bacterium]